MNKEIDYKTAYENVMIANKMLEQELDKYKKPQAIDQNFKRWIYIYNTKKPKKTNEQLIENVEVLREKINEIIWYLDELKGE